MKAKATSERTLLRSDFFTKKSVIHAVVPPFLQEGTLGLGCSLINAFETFFCRCYPFARKAPSAVYKRYDLPGHIIKKCRTQKSLGLNAMEKYFNLLNSVLKSDIIYYWSKDEMCMRRKQK